MIVGVTKCDQVGYGERSVVRTAAAEVAAIGGVPRHRDQESVTTA